MNYEHTSCDLPFETTGEAVLVGLKKQRRFEARGWKIDKDKT